MNYKISNITVGLDFSESSLNALHSARFIAAKFGATLNLLYSSEKITGHTGRDRYYRPDTSSATLAALASDLSRNDNIKTVVIEDKRLAIEALISASLENKSNLIVLGSSGESGHRDGFIGTTVYNVIKFAPCPVLVIPPFRKWNEFKKPLFPVRPIFTAMRHYDIVRNFLDIQAQMQVFGLSSVDEERMDGELDDIVTQIESVLKIRKASINIGWAARHSIPRDILNQVHKMQSDLIILTPAIDVSIKPYFIGPNTHYILNHARVPLLVINRLHK